MVKLSMDSPILEIVVLRTNLNLHWGLQKECLKQCKVWTCKIDRKFNIHKI
jgi:hypothetical protein